jgi:hypothetical protein
MIGGRCQSKHQSINRELEYLVPMLSSKHLGESAQTWEGRETAIEAQ